VFIEVIVECLERVIERIEVGYRVFRGDKGEHRVFRGIVR